jgi:PST family polysaccharide transporter
MSAYVQPKKDEHGSSLKVENIPNRPKSRSRTLGTIRTVLNEIAGSSNLVAIFRNFTWLALDRVVRMGLGVVLTIWIARYLGPSQFGLFNYAAAFVALFTPVASLGLDSILVRDLLRESEPARMSSMGTAFLMRFVGGWIAVGLALVVNLVVRPGEEISEILVIIAAIGLVAQSADVIDFWFQSLLQSRKVVIARGVSFLVLAFVRIGLLIGRYSLVWFAAAALAELMLSGISLFVAYRASGARMIRWRYSWERMVGFLRDGWPLAFSMLAILIYLKIGQVMVGNMLGDRAIGNYSAAVRLAEVWFFIPTAVGSSVLPSIIRAKAQNKSRYRNRLQLSYNVMSLISIAIAAFLSLFSSTIIRVLYGIQFVEASPVLSIYAWATVPVFLGVASGIYLLAENLTRINLYRTIAGSVVNIVLNMVLIPVFGIVGAALSALCAYIVSTFSLFFFPATREEGLYLLKSLNPVWVFHLFRQKTLWQDENG